MLLVGAISLGPGMHPCQGSRDKSTSGLTRTSFASFDRSRALAPCLVVLSDSQATSAALRPCLHRRLVCSLLSHPHLLMSSPFPSSLLLSVHFVLRVLRVASPGSECFFAKSEILLYSTSLCDARLRFILLLDHSQSLQLD